MGQAVLGADPGAGGQVDLTGDPKRLRRERIVKGLFLTAAVLSIAVSASIIGSLVFEAVDFLRQVDTAALVSEGWFPRRGLFDILTLVIGSVLVTLVAMLIAVPLGLAAAVYLSEYANPRVRRIVKPVLETLAGIPSVVIGFFALAWIAPNVVARLSSTAQEFSLAAAGIGVGVLVIPLVASVSEDAMRAVPNTLREASYGMGAKRVTTVTRVVLPAAVSGLVASFIIAVSRAIGETMVVAIAAGATGGSLRTWNVFAPGQTMTAAMAALATGTDQVRGASAAFPSLFFVGLLLFLITAALNLVADVFVRRVRQRY
jgi:phosphate transport system permease protein